MISVMRGENFQCLVANLRPWKRRTKTITARESHKMVQAADSLNRSAMLFFELQKIAQERDELALQPASLLIRRLPCLGLNPDLLSLITLLQCLELLLSGR